MGKRDTIGKLPKSFKWKKAYVLKKHWEIYSQKKCSKKHPVKKEDLGKNKRVTYFCKDCQKLYKIKD